MLRKTHSGGFKAISFDKDGLPTEFEGYAAVFDNIDLGGDKIIKGAFADAQPRRLSFYERKCVHAFYQRAGVRRTSR